MNWPLPQDINEAIQNPATAFADPVLGGGTVPAGPMGVPLPRSGGFADVYKVRGSDGRDWAIKCFTRPVPGLQERYEAISDHLSKSALPFTVDFQFLSRGMTVRGMTIPVVKMAWVEGLPLNEFVSENLGRTTLLESLLGIWARLCRRLRETGLAHADIQHGNVLLVPGTTKTSLGIKLVDYDGMFVPALADQPPAETGHPSFQHPERVSKQIYSSDLDRFPHLVVATALRGLLVGGKALWDRYDGGDNLLFREKDFREPAKSKLMRELWDSGDPATIGLLANLVIACSKPLSQTPWLDLIMPDGRPVLTPRQETQAAELLGLAAKAPVPPLPTPTPSPPIAPAPPGIPTGSKVFPAGLVPSGSSHSGSALPASPSGIRPAPAIPAPAIPATPVRAKPVGAPASVPSVPARAVPAPSANEFTFDPSTADPDPARKSTYKGPRRSKVPLFLGLGVLILVGAAAGGFLFLKSQKQAEVAETPTPPPPTDPGPPPDGEPVSTKVPEVKPIPIRLAWQLEPPELGGGIPRGSRFSFDDKRIIVFANGETPTVANLDVETGETQGVFRKHAKTCVAGRGPNSSIVTLAGGSPNALVWNGKDPEANPRYLLPNQALEYTRIETTPDGEVLLVETKDGTYLSTPDGRDLTPKFASKLGFLALSRASDRVLALNLAEKSLVVWSLTDSKKLGTTSASGVTGIEAWSPDGKFAVVAGAATGKPPATALRVLDLATGQSVRNLDAGYLIGKGRFSADGSHLALLAKSGVVEVWRTSDWARVAEVKSAGVPQALDLSSDAKRLVIAGPDKSVRVYFLGEIETVVDNRPPTRGTLTERWRANPLSEPGEILKSTAVSPDGKVVYTLVERPLAKGGAGLVLRAFDATFSDRLFEKSVGQAGNAPSVVIPVAKKVVAIAPSGRGGFSLTQLAVPTGTAIGERPVAIAKSVPLLPGTYAVSADGHYFATLMSEGDGNAIAIWDLDTNQNIRTIPLTGTPPRAIAFRPGAETSSLVVAHANRVGIYPGPEFEAEKSAGSKLELGTGDVLGASPEGGYLAMSRPGDGGNTIFVSDIRSGTNRELFQKKQPIDLGFLAGNRVFLAESGGVAIGNTVSGRLASEAVFPEKVKHAAVSADGSLLVAVLESDRITAFHANWSGNPDPPIPAAKKFETLWARRSSDLSGARFGALGIAPNGTVAVTAGPRILRLTPTGLLSALRTETAPEEVAFSRSGSMFVFEPGDDRPRFRAYDATGKPAAKGLDFSTLRSRFSQFELAPEAQTILGKGRGEFVVWSQDNGKPIWTRSANTEEVTRSYARLYGSHSVLVIRNSDAAEDRFEVVDVLTRRPVLAGSLPQGTAGPIADANPISGLAVVHFEERDELQVSTKVLDLRAGRVLHSLQGSVVGKPSPRLVRNGRILVAASGSTLTLLEAASGKELASDTFPGTIDEIRVTEDGQLAAILFSEGDTPRSVLSLVKLPPDLTPQDVLPGNRLPTPPDEDVEKALTAMKELYKKEYAAPSKKAFVETLLREGKEPRGKPATRFAMLSEAIRLAGLSADMALLQQATETMGKSFDGNEYELFAKAAEATAGKLVQPMAFRNLAQSCEDAADIAADLMLYDTANHLLAIAINALDRGGLGASVPPLRDRIKLFNRWKARATSYRDGLEKLKSTPDDGDANQSVGTFLCFVRGRWEEGLPYLSHASDPSLAAAAQAEASTPLGAGGEMVIAGKWADAGKGSEEDRPRCDYRARYWYVRAAAVLVGPERKAAEEKLGFSRQNIEYFPGTATQLLQVNDKGVPVKKLKGVFSPVASLTGTNIGEKEVQVRAQLMGVLLPPQPGRYRLVVRTTAPTKCDVDKKTLFQLVAEQIRDLTMRTASVDLSDRPTQFDIVWLGRGGPNSRLTLSWIPPGGVEQPIPPECLFHTKQMATNSK